MTSNLTVQGPTYFSKGDERSMFEWLGRIKAIGKVSGSGRDLQIDLVRQPTKEELLEVVALFYRYRMDMKCLAALSTPSNQGWFQNPENYWFNEVFGTAVDR